MIKHTFLLELRNNQGISQAFVAEKIGVSRASYIEIEKGSKELTLSQANTIAEIFNITLAELISGKKISDVKVSINDIPEKKERQEIRIDVPQKNLKKFKEVLLYVLKKIVESMESKGELETVRSKYFQHEQTKYLPHRKPDISVLNAKEIKHINEVLSRLSDKNATELKDYSHKDVPWITAEEGRPLSYESVFYRTKDTSVREYEPDHL